MTTLNFDVFACSGAAVVAGAAVVGATVVAAAVVAGAAVVGASVVAAAVDGAAEAAGPTAVPAVVAGALADEPPHDAATRMKAKTGSIRRISGRYTRRVAACRPNVGTVDHRVTSTGQNLSVILFDGELRSRLQTNLSTHERRMHPLEGRRAAAVAIVVVDSAVETIEDPFEVEQNADIIVPGNAAGFDDRMNGVSGGAAFLLCRRAARLSSHSRQWALPGGRIDAGETAVEAAHREVAEEVGLDLGADALLGVLDDFPTRSGYVITPVVFWADATVGMTNNPSEVAYTYRVSLAQLQRPDSPRYVDIPESDRPVVQLPLGRALIHAPTGAVLLQFRWVALDGRPNERVDHLEQPVFAWK